MSKLTEVQISLSYKHFPESCVGTSARACAHTHAHTHVHTQFLSHSPSSLKISTTTISNAVQV